MKIEFVEFPEKLNNHKILFNGDKLLINSKYHLSKSPDILANSISFLSCSGEMSSPSYNVPT